jgi:hypothetical protein
MSESKYPAGWDADRVKRLIDHYESISEEDQAAEDDAAVEEKQGQTVVTVPDGLMPAIRQLLAGHKAG